MNDPFDIDIFETVPGQIAGVAILILGLIYVLAPLIIVSQLGRINKQLTWIRQNQESSDRNSPDDPLS